MSKRVSMSHAFKVRHDVFKRGVVYSISNIADLVRNNGWYCNDYSERQNRQRVRSALQEAYLMRRAERPKRGHYIFN